MITQDDLETLTIYWAHQLTYCDDLLTNGQPTAETPQTRQPLPQETRMEIEAYRRIVESTLEYLNELKSPQA